MDDDKVPLLQSNACANRIYPASSLDKDFADKFHQDLTQNPGDCRTRLEVSRTLFIICICKYCVFFYLHTFIAVSVT